MIRLIFIAYLTTFVFEGPIRFVLGSVGGGAFLYLRDVAMLEAMYIAFILQPATQIREQRPFLIVLEVLLVHAVVGLIILGNLFQVLFGFKVFLPLLLGALAYRDFTKDPKRYLLPIALLFLAGVTGVIGEHFVHYPWTGFLYDVGGVTLGNREWSMFGDVRPAGFARASFEAAAEFLCLSIVLVCYLRPRVLAWCFWLLAGVGIVATTTKGVAAAFIACSAFLVARAVFPLPSRWHARALIPIAAIMTLLPLLGDASMIHINWRSRTDVILFSSLWARLAFAWPDALRLVQDHGSIIFGRGLGGIGASQMFEYVHYSPADNLGIYLYATFGVFGFAYLGFVLIRAQRLDIRARPLDAQCLLLVLGALVFGLTANVIESATFSVWIGVVVAHLIALGPRTQTIREGRTPPPLLSGRQALTPVKRTAGASAHRQL